MIGTGIRLKYVIVMPVVDEEYVNYESNIMGDKLLLNFGAKFQR